MVERSLPSVVRNPEQTAQVARLMHGLSLLVILIPALFVSAVKRIDEPGYPPLIIYQRVVAQ